MSTILTAHNLANGTASSTHLTNVMNLRVQAILSENASGYVRYIIEVAEGTGEWVPARKEDGTIYQFSTRNSVENSINIVNLNASKVRVTLFPDNITTGTVSLVATVISNDADGFVSNNLSSDDISLAVSRNFPTSAGYKLDGEKVTIQLVSSNLSGATTFAPQISVDGIVWDVAQENGTDISHTLADDVAFVQTYESQKGMYWRWVMAEGTTGTVSYALMGGVVIPDAAT